MAYETAIATLSYVTTEIATASDIYGVRGDNYLEEIDPPLIRPYANHRPWLDTPAPQSIEVYDPKKVRGALARTTAMRAMSRVCGYRSQRPVELQQALEPVPQYWPVAQMQPSVPAEPQPVFRQPKPEVQPRPEPSEFDSTLASIRVLRQDLDAFRQQQAQEDMQQPAEPVQSADRPLKRIIIDDCRDDDPEYTGPWEVTEATGRYIGRLLVGKN